MQVDENLIDEYVQYCPVCKQETVLIGKKDKNGLLTSKCNHQFTHEEWDKSVVINQIDVSIFKLH